MPQISSTDQLLILAQVMTEDLKHPHPDVTFATIRDDTITALTTLASIFIKKRQPPSASNNNGAKGRRKQTARISGPTSTHVPSQTHTTNQIVNPKQSTIPSQLH